MEQRGRGRGRGGRGGGGGGRGGGQPSAPAGYGAPPQQQQYQQPSMAPTTAAVEALALSPSGPLPTLPNRPGYGRVGRPIKLSANWFDVKFTLDEVFMYSVQVTRAEGAPGGQAATGRPMPAGLCRAAMREAAALMASTAKTAGRQGWPNGCWAFDGRQQLYSPFDLLPEAQETIELTVNLVAIKGEKKRDDKFNVAITRAGVIGMDTVRRFLTCDLF
jgi:hypothetical protein